MELPCGRFENCNSCVKLPVQEARNICNGVGLLMTSNSIEFLQSLSLYEVRDLLHERLAEVVSEDISVTERMVEAGSQSIIELCYQC